ncbi:protein phosphatase CheZ [Kiloniella sp. b19]|uniref:protein phosphatase CheZ n=1 Tax=Kiloniella sp. GXU_MW_B19 TaxID=3141326 RepID=UPI0031D19767
MSLEPKGEFSAERVQRLRRGLTADAKVSNLQLFEAINELRSEMHAMKSSIANVRTQSAEPSSAPAVEGEHNGPPEHHAEDVRLEIAQMVRMIGKTKREIAQIKHPSVEEEDDRVTKATNELDAILMATETATHSILDASEKIEQTVDELSKIMHDDPDVQAACEKIAGHVITVLEASNFQDITGQRMTKVINTLRFIEDRIMAMINIWGVDAFIDMPVDIDDGRSDDEKLMNGPAGMNEGSITQDDIDALFD